MPVNLRQVSFRGRNDDGTETTATWIDAVNANWTQFHNTPFRLRFLADENGGTLNKDWKPHLEYNKNAAGWNDVTVTSSVVRPHTTNTNLTDEEDTTQQIGSGTFISPNKAVHVADAEMNDKLLDMQNNEVELEYALVFQSADVANGDTIQFRMVRKDNSLLEEYVNTPTVTISKVITAQTGFRWRNDDGSESAATWREALNDQGLAPLDTNIRLRWRVEETGGGTSNIQPRVYVRRNAGSFAEIGQQGSANAVRLVNSTNLTNDQATTDQLGGAASFTAGRVIESRPPDSITSTSLASQRTEFEAVFEFSSANGAAAGDRFEFEIRTDSGAQLDSYDQISALRIQESFSVVSIQKRTINFNTEQELTSTITSVDTAKTIILFSVETGPDPSVGQPENTLFRVDLQNATTVRARRGNTAPSFVATMEVYILEFNGIRVDRGLASFITVLLTAAQRGDVKRSIPLHSWLTTQGSWANDDFGISDLGLVNGDVQQILWESIGTPAGFAQAWQVIHLLDPNHSLQTGDIAISGASGTLALSPSVTTGRTIVLSSVKATNATANDIDRILTKTDLSSTQVTATRNTASGTIEVRPYVWEFAATDGISVQRALLTIPTSASFAEATLSPTVAVADSTPVNHHLSQVLTDSSSAFDRADTWMVRRKITATNTYRIERAETNASFIVEEYYQVVEWISVLSVNLSGNLTTAGNLLHQPRKLLSGALTTAGVLIALVINFFAGTLTSAGNLILQIIRTFAGTLTSSGNIIKQPQQSQGGTFSSTGDPAMQVGKGLTGALTSAGNLLKNITQTFTGSLTLSGVLGNIKTVILNLAGTLTLAGNLIKVPQQILAGTLSTIGTLILFMTQSFAGVLSTSGNLVKQPQLTFQGILSKAGNLISEVRISLAGTITTSGILTNIKVALLSVAGALTTAGSLILQPRKLFAGTISTTGSLILVVDKLLGGTLTTAGVLLFKVLHTLSGSLTLAGIVSNIKVAILNVAGALSTAGTLIFRITTTFVGTLTTTGNLIKQIPAAFVSTLTTAGNLILQPNLIFSGITTTAGILVNLPRKLFNGTLTLSGNLIKQIVHILSGVLTTAGVLANNLIIARTFVATLTISGNLLKQIQHFLAGILTTNGALTNIISTVFSGTITLGGNLLNQVQKILSGIITTAGTLVHFVGKLVDGVSTFTGNLIKQVQTTFVSTLSISGILSNIKVAILSVAGTLTTAGNLIKSPIKIFNGLLSSVGTIIRQVNKIFAGVGSLAGNLIKEVRIGFNSTLTTSGAITVVKVVVIALSGTLTLSGNLIKQVGKILGGVFTHAGNLVKQPSKLLSGLSGLTGDLFKQVANSFISTLISSGIVNNQTQKRFSAILTTSGVVTVIRIAFIVLTAVLTTSGVLTKVPRVVFSGILSTTGSIIKSVSHFVGGALSFIGSLINNIISGLSSTPIKLRGSSTNIIRLKGANCDIINLRGSSKEKIDLLGSSGGGGYVP